MRPRITLTNAVGLTRVTSNRRVNQSSRIFLLTRPGFIEVDAAARHQSSFRRIKQVAIHAPAARVQRFTRRMEQSAGCINHFFTFTCFLSQAAKVSQYPETYLVFRTNSSAPYGLSVSRKLWPALGKTMTVKSLFPALRNAASKMGTLFFVGIASSSSPFKAKTGTVTVCKMGRGS